MNDFHADAERILLVHDEAVDRLRQSDLKGRVRLGCADDVIAERLAVSLARFRRVHPEVRLEVVVDTSPSLKWRFLEGELDTAIVQQHSGLGAQRVLWREQPPWELQREAMVDALRPLPIVSFGKPCDYWAAATQALGNAGIDWFPVLECSSTTAVRSAIAAGVGVGILAARHFDPVANALTQSENLPRLPIHDFILLEAGEEKPSATALIAILLDEFGISEQAAA